MAEVIKERQPDVIALEIIDHANQLASHKRAIEQLQIIVTRLEKAAK
jgi:hypothetical protein